MIGYHWSPTVRRGSIEKHGLLVPAKHPVLVQPVVCSDGHRNPHVSLGRTPHQAWDLSGGFLRRREVEQGRNPSYSLPLNRCRWDLWQVDLSGIRYTHRGGYEIRVRVDIPRSRTTWIAERLIK